MNYDSTRLRLNIMLVVLSAALSASAMQYNPKDLKNLAGGALANNVTSICNLQMPEECRQYLGLIEIQNIGPFTQILENVGIRAIDGKEYLDINATEYFSKKSFAQLIEEKNKQGLTLILAGITIKQAGTYAHTYYDAHALHKYLKLGSSKHRYVKKVKQFTDPWFGLPIICEIQYFTINSAQELQASLLCTDYDLYFDKSNQNFFYNFFRANEPCPFAQIDLAFAYEKSGNTKQAKHYYMLAAYQQHTSAMSPLGHIYEKEGDIEQAKYYYNLAAQHGYAIAKYYLFNLYEKEGDIDQAKLYYNCALEQYLRYKNISYSKDYKPGERTPEDCAQCILGFICKEEGNLIQAKEHFFVAADLGNITAQYHLGLIFIEEENIEQAKVYLGLARQKGHKLAALELKKLS